MPMDADIVTALTERFRHFNAERAAPLFAADQTGGVVTVAKQGNFPGVHMANGSVWFFDPDRRPVRKDDKPMKTRAPHGERRLLCDDPSAEELTFVEGEGHAVALASVGMTGVVACGGVNVFQSKSGWAKEELLRLAQGKRVRLIFDNDAAGRRATGEVTRRLLDVGATRVAVLPAQDDWLPGWDIEDWLASFEAADTAYWTVVHRLGSLEWVDEAAQVRDEEADEAMPQRFVRTERPEGSLVVTVWDEEERTMRLAVVGPPSEEPVQEFESVRHDADPADAAIGRGWQMLEAWLHEGYRYVPDDRGAMLGSIRRGTIVPPAPPSEGYGTSEGLWKDITTFMESWLALRSPAQYDVLAAYCFMSYRVFDARFPYVPYLRFHGPPGTGKGRALAVMKQLCCWTLDGQPTADNLHRVIEYFGEITLVVDEFHLDRGQRREVIERIIDTLNLGNDLQKTKLRCDMEDGQMVVNAFSLFGPKIFAGYGYDEHEALARRTVNIDMSGIEVPQGMSLFALPPRFYADAYLLRQRLMAWRGTKLDMGLPDPEGSRATVLLKESGREVGQIFWPLLEMVPYSMPRAEEAVLEAAIGRKMETQATRAVSDEAYLLEAFGNATAFELGGPGRFYRTADIVALVNEHLSATPNIAKGLKKLGLMHARKRVDQCDHPVGGFLLTGTAEERRIFERHGVTYPDPEDTTVEEPAL